ncbi:MAG: phage terminase large subunit [bacterium]
MDPRIGAAVAELVRRRGLYDFVKRFWHTVEPAEFVGNWHLQAICCALQAVSLRRINRLVINVPPGTGKSLLTSVFWPAWQWTWQPEHKWLCTGYSPRLVARDAKRCMRIVQSPLYRAAWPGVEFTESVPAVSELHTTAGGLRVSLQIGGGITGWHGDTLICDDPLKAADASSIAKIEAVNDTWKTVAATRRANPKRHAVVLIMQRLADNDLAAEELATGAEHLCLPMRYVPDCPWDRGLSLGKLDPRTKTGELLFPERFPESAVRELERALETPQNISAQLQQNPVPASGAFFEDAWFRTWTELPTRWRLQVVQSWDFNVGETRDPQAASRVHGALWAWCEGRYFLLDEVSGTWNYPEAKRQFLAAQRRTVAGIGWREAECVLIECKANGAPLIAEMREEHPGMVISPISPHEPKELRARRHSARVEAGQVYLPDEPWAGEFRAELVRFPKQKHNDRVDTTTQALDYMAAPNGLAQWGSIGEA